MTSRTGSLADIKVIDASRVLGGPYAGQILGDHGADSRVARPRRRDPPTGPARTSCLANAAAVGLRNRCSPEEAAEVLAVMRDRSSYSGYTGQNWNRRYREYTERLKSSSLFDVGHVLKELILIGAEKDLSFGERRLLEQAMALMTSELSCVLRREAEAIKAEIESFFADLLVKEEKIE